jgi:hypothetical protein
VDADVQKRWTLDGHDRRGPIAAGLGRAAPTARGHAAIRGARRRRRPQPGREDARGDHRGRARPRIDRDLLHPAPRPHRRAARAVGPVGSILPRRPRPRFRRRPGAAPALRHQDLEATHAPRDRAQRAGPQRQLQPGQPNAGHDIPRRQHAPVGPGLRPSHRPRAARPPHHRSAAIFVRGGTHLLVVYDDGRGLLWDLRPRPTLGRSKRCMSGLSTDALPAPAGDAPG